MIDWAAPTDVIFNMIRALSYPFPGAFTYYRGNQLTIREAVPLPDAPRYSGRIPGRVVKIDKITGFRRRLDGRWDLADSDGGIRWRNMFCGQSDHFGTSNARHRLR